MFMKGLLPKTKENMLNIAEESVAASEELVDQAKILSTMLQDFKLK